MSDEPIHPLEKIRQAAEEKRERQEKEEVYCPECDTKILKDEVEDALETAEEHDETRHGGDRVTLVNGILPPEFSEEEKEEIQEAVNRITPDDE